jgi:hypothetical protein
MSKNRKKNFLYQSEFYRVGFHTLTWICRFILKKKDGMRCNTICATERINTAYGKKELFFSLTFDSTAEIRIYPHHGFKLKKKNLKQLGFVRESIRICL